MLVYKPILPWRVPVIECQNCRVSVIGIPTEIRGRLASASSVPDTGPECWTNVQRPCDAAHAHSIPESLGFWKARGIA